MNNFRWLLILMLAVGCGAGSAVDLPGTGGSDGGSAATSGGGSAATGGGAAATGGGSAATGGGSAATGGGSAATGGGSVATGGGSAATGGGSTATGGGSAATGGGSTATGGGSAATGGGSAATGGGSTATGGGSVATGGGSAATGGGSAATGGGLAGSGVTYFFSDCQTGAAEGCQPGNDANAGTQAAPKQTLIGINVNTLPAGSQLLFRRGGAWNWTTTLRLENHNASASSPLIFGAYGTGAAPLIRQSSPFFVETGEWANTVSDGGYVFRGLKFEALSTAPNDAKAIWLRGTVSDVLIDDVEITGYYIGLYGQGHDDIQRVTVRNSRFIRNRGMGVLGTFNNSLFEGNLFEANNFSGSGFDHGTYLSNFTNLTLRNNVYLRNSVVSGVCQGGNMTFHGQVDGLLIEGNRIEQSAAAPGCWLMSITQGYTTAEWFLNVVVRNNKLINGGNTGIALQSAPGVLVEGNVVINNQATNQTAISIGQTDYSNGDVPDGNATVRNNTACQSGGATGNVVNVVAPNSAVSNNVVLTGAAATMGICAL